MATYSNDNQETSSALREEFIPMGLRFCPVKKNKRVKARNRYDYDPGLFISRMCDTTRCALWNDEAGRCGLLR